MGASSNTCTKKGNCRLTRATTQTPLKGRQVTRQHGEREPISDGVSIRNGGRDYWH